MFLLSLSLCKLVTCPPHRFPYFLPPVAVLMRFLTYTHTHTHTHTHAHTQFFSPQHHLPAAAAHHQNGSEERVQDGRGRDSVARSIPRLHFYRLVKPIPWNPSPTSLSLPVSSSLFLSPSHPPSSHTRTRLIVRVM
jgi:hypothetical protein